MQAIYVEETEDGRCSTLIYCRHGCLYVCETRNSESMHSQEQVEGGPSLVLHCSLFIRQSLQSTGWSCLPARQA